MTCCTASYVLFILDVHQANKAIIVIIIFFSVVRNVALHKPVTLSSYDEDFGDSFKVTDGQFGRKGLADSVHTGRSGTTVWSDRNR